MNPYQLGIGSSRPESIWPGQLGLCDLVIEAAHIDSLYDCMGISMNIIKHRHPKHAKDTTIDSGVLRRVLVNSYFYQLVLWSTRT